MSFFKSFANSAIGKTDPLIRSGVDHGLDNPGQVKSNLGLSKKPPLPPAVPNPNDALNASQAQTDAMRMRRGMLANIYAGSSSTQPLTGSNSLGT